MSGFYLMHRGWMDNPALGGAREPFCRRAAWAWLIENAVYQEARVGIGRKTVTLRRGQLSYSLRFLAGAWGWDDPKVRRFIARLVEEKMIDCVTDAGQCVITVCNYEEYQNVASVTDAPTDADATQTRRSGDANKKEGKEIKELTKEADASLGADGADDGSRSDETDTELVWGKGLNWLAKASGRQPKALRSLVGRWCKGGREAAVLALMRECREHSPPIEDPIPWIETALANRSQANVRQAQAQQHRPAARSYGEDPDARRRGILDALAHRVEPSGTAA